MVQSRKANEFNFVRWCKSSLLRSRLQGDTSSLKGVRPFEMTAEFDSGYSDVGSITKNDQLYDQIVVHGEIEGAVDQFGYFHRQSLADDIALRPLPNRRLSPVSRN